MVLLDTVYSGAGNGLVGHCVQRSRKWSCWTLRTAEQEMVMLDTVFSVVGNGHVGHCVQCCSVLLDTDCVQCSREWSCWTLCTV